MICLLLSTSSMQQSLTQIRLVNSNPLHLSKPLIWVSRQVSQMSFIFLLEQMDEGYIYICMST